MKSLWMSDFDLRAHFRSIRLKVTLVAAVAFFTLVPLFAAMAQEDDAFMLEEITVTGSRIRGVEGVGTSVIGLAREDIEVAASLTVDKIIKELPSIMDLGVTEVTRAQSGGAMNRTAASSINIHGIGPYSTLTLLDGHRMTNNGMSPEPGVFPTLGVERIEVVADGASAVYGSDAVAGVVNIIPRRRLDGVETMFKFGQAADMDPEWKAGAAVGKTWDSGGFMVAYEHTYRGSLLAEDRPYYTADQRPWGGPDYRTRQSSPGTIIVGGGRSGLPETTYAIPEGGVTPETANLLVPGTQNLFETYPGKAMLPEQEYDNAMFTFNQVINDIEFFADGFYSNREFVSTRNGYLSGDITVPSTNAFFVQPPGMTVNSYTVALSTADIPGVSPDYMVGEVEHWQISPGFRYNLPYGFQLEALYNYGESSIFQSYEGGADLRNPATAALFASSDPATAIDVYGLGRTTPETVAKLCSVYNYNPVDNEFQGYQVSVSGPVFELPGGAMRIAAGYEGQRYELINGVARGNYPDPPQYDMNPAISRDVDSFYFEAYIPLFGSKNATTGLNRLELTAAIRYDDYSDVGSTTNPKIGFNYSPIEQLMFHGSYGTSFRAPLMEDLGVSGWSNYSLMIQFYQTPEGGTIQGYTLRGANPDLVPEESDNISIGVAYTPTENTLIKLDYWSVKYDKQIVSYMADTVSLLGVEDQFAGSGVILRDAEAAAKVVELAALGIDTRGRGWIGGSPEAATLYVDGRSLNLGTSTTQGIDFQISHNLQTDTAGLFRFTLDGTYLTAYKVAYTAGKPEYDKLNQINQPLRFKARGAVTWQYAPFTTQVGLRYINEYDNTSVVPTQKVDSWTPIDLVFRFDGDDVGWLGSFGTGLSVSLEARNAFDEDPPYVNFAPNMSGGGGWDPSAADPVGRLIALTLRKKF